MSHELHAAECHSGVGGRAYRGKLENRARALSNDLQAPGVRLDHRICSTSRESYQASCASAHHRGLSTSSGTPCWSCSHGRGQAHCDHHPWGRDDRSDLGRRRTAAADSLNLLSGLPKFTPEGGRVDMQVPPREPGISDRLRTPAKHSAGFSAVGVRFVPSGRRIDHAGASGLGLGLAIVKHLVEAHGGTVSARASAPGAARCSRCGAFASVDPAMPGVDGLGPSNPLTDSIVSLDGLLVLVVDDDVESRDVVAADRPPRRRRDGCIRGRRSSCRHSTST